MDAPIIPQILPITLMRISSKPSRLFLKTKPIALENNFTFLAEKCFCWAVKTMNTGIKDYNAKNEAGITTAVQ